MANAPAANQSPVSLWQVWCEASRLPLQFHYLPGGKTAGQQQPHGAGQLCPGGSLELDGMHFELKRFRFHAPSENSSSRAGPTLEGTWSMPRQGELAVVAVMFRLGQAMRLEPGLAGVASQSG